MSLYVHIVHAVKWAEYFVFHARCASGFKEKLYVDVFYNNGKLFYHIDTEFWTF